MKNRVITNRVSNYGAVSKSEFVTNDKSVDKIPSTSKSISKSPISSVFNANKKRESIMTQPRQSVDPTDIKH